MIGVLRPPKSSRFHARLLPLPPSGLIVSGSPVSRLMLLCSGPRQYGQSSGSILASSAALHGTIVVQTTNREDTTGKSGQFRFMMKTRDCGSLGELFGGPTGQLAGDGSGLKSRGRRD